MKQVFIIAEAGVNHNGNIDLAKQLIDVASNAGANAVKFQTFKASNLVRKDAKKANYQIHVYHGDIPKDRRLETTINKYVKQSIGTTHIHYNHDSC